MLTPCDDKDAVAAITTARLFGEDDSSMMNLELKSGTTPVSYTELLIVSSIYTIWNSLRLLLYRTN